MDKADTTGKAGTDASTTGMAYEPAGIGGWLILLLIGQIGGAIRLLYAIVTDVNLYSRAPPQAHIAIHIELALSLTMPGLVVWSTVQMLRERSSFPMWWKIMGVAAILFPIVNGALISAVLGVPLTRFYFLREAAQTFAVIVTVGIWWLYLNLSVRVKNTFVM